MSGRWGRLSLQRQQSSLFTAARWTANLPGRTIGPVSVPVVRRMATSGPRRPESTCVTTPAAKAEVWVAGIVNEHRVASPEGIPLELQHQAAPLFGGEQDAVTRIAEPPLRCLGRRPRRVARKHLQASPAAPLGHVGVEQQCVRCRGPSVGRLAGPAAASLMVSLVRWGVSHCVLSFVGPDGEKRGRRWRLLWPRRGMVTRRSRTAGRRGRRGRYADRTRTGRRWRSG